MTREARLLKVDALLGDKAGVPWLEPGTGLRVRTLAALSPRAEAISSSGTIRVRWFAAAALIVLTGVVTVVMVNGRGTRVDQGVSVGRLDPSPLLAPAFRMLTVSADESLATEARELIQSTNEMTRRVVAQLPFTGGS